MSLPKFNIGDTVKVVHPHEGTWIGVVTYRANAGDEDYGDAWEYEVSNAPTDRNNQHGLIRNYGSGERWHPLAWESEMELVE